MLNVYARSMGTVGVLCVQGQIVNGETETLRNAVDALPPVSTVILDLTRVTTVDAHGLGVLLEMRERINTRGARFQLMNVSEPMRRVLEITRLDTVFQVVSGVGIFPKFSQGKHTVPPALRSCA